ncbi:MAG: AAA family ATPase [Fibromonadaceae bacterium]|jgi:DNA repair exonuclease SbcCD ATPase subunit|nr:AAA family ATPase [Fibromonadaceae bacterium]
MQIAISNFRGINDASFELGKITIIGGENGAGKTSIAQAISAALTGECPIKEFQKKDYRHLVRIGKPVANIEVKGDSGTAVMQFPEGKAWREGTPPSMSLYASGLISPLDMKKSDAANAWIVLLKAEPTLENLREELKEFENIEEIIQLVKSLGYDGALGNVKEEGAKHKGRWERITGERYGTSRAESWFPNGFVAVGEKEALEADLKAKQEAYNESLKKNAVSDYERANLDAKFKKYPELQSQSAECEKNIIDLNLKLTNAKTRLQDLQDANNLLKCPHCDKYLRLVANKLTKAEEGEFYPNEKAINEVKAQIQNLQTQYNTEINERAKIATQISEARAAKEKLNSSVVAEPNTTAANELQTAKDALAACNSYNEAKVENKEVMWRIEAAKILAPEGLRKRFLEKKLKEFNEFLKQLCDAAEWATIKIEPDLSVSFNDKPYPVLSKSEQYRTRCTIQAALAVLLNSDLVIYDGADILTKKGRNGLYNICTEIGDINSIILLSANKASEIPRLEEENKSFWIENNTIEQI